jgi:ribokinase
LFVASCETLLFLCDWLILNEYEATRLSGIEVTSLETAREVATFIRKRSSHVNILIILGNSGAWLDTSSFIGHVPAFAVEAVDTVGAGDTFIGAFVSRLVGGAAPLEATRFGCAAAALAVTRRGAQAGIPTRAEVETFLGSALPSLAG